jgi:hypothetical protein
VSRRRRRPTKDKDRDKGKSKGKAKDSKQQAAGAFWRNTEPRDTAPSPIVPTRDPAAVPRSLGDPPLSPDTAAQHHLAVVYEEAVRTATALAAANGLLAELPPTDDL